LTELGADENKLVDMEQFLMDEPRNKLRFPAYYDN
jgi:hypothetical protein